MRKKSQRRIRTRNDDFGLPKSDYLTEIAHEVGYDVESEALKVIECPSPTATRIVIHLPEPMTQSEHNESESCAPANNEEENSDQIECPALKHNTCSILKLQDDQ